MNIIKIKVKRSNSEKDKRKNCNRRNSDEEPNTITGSLLIRWFREIRSGYLSTNPTKTVDLADDERVKRPKDQRRYSFNCRQVTPLPQRRRIRTDGFQVCHNSKTNTLPPLGRKMMPSRSTPNLQQTNRPDKNPTTIYTYLQNQTNSTVNNNKTTAITIVPSSSTTTITSSASCSSTGSTTTTIRDDDSPPPAPPVRDSSTLKSIKYGPGHEKFPSWPVPAAAETPPALRTPPGGGSHRSKSWTDHTNYPKEKIVTYTRPYMKRQHSTYTQQKLKTVMERCEKIPPETYESRYDKLNDRLYLSHVDRDGKPLGDMDYSVPSPPERDIANNKPQLTQADLEEYAKSYQDPVKYQYDDTTKTTHPTHLTKSGLEEFMEYTRNYEDSLFNSINSKHDEAILTHLHQKQLSYAQSEGYHSYVSSTDSTSTPFLDRLRRDSEAVVTTTRTTANWDDEQEQNQARREGRDSVVTNSSGSVSSSETLKWHGSMSDVSVASSSCTHLANSSNSSTVSRQLIAHSARVQTPQRHHSESVLYMSGDNNSDNWKDRENRNNNTNKLKLFAVNTYTMQETETHSNSMTSLNMTTNSSRLAQTTPLQSTLSVSDRINELEKQQKYSYLDPAKKHKVPDPTLKAIQKKALLSFYERHQNPNKNCWRSEPQLAQSQQIITAVPQPPPKIKVQLPSRRASSASDYVSSNSSKRNSLASTRESKTTDNINKPRHQHSNSCGSLSTDLLGPVIIGPSISVDDWIPDRPPARPPKNPNLRTVYPDLFHDQRVPSPDLPPPSPPTVLEDEVINNDDPFPPPPPECENDWQQEFNDRLKENTTLHQLPAPQVQKSPTNSKNCKSPIKQTVGLPEQNRFASVRSSLKTKSTGHIFQQVSGKPCTPAIIIDKNKLELKHTEQILDFPTQQTYAERSSAKYPQQKMIANGYLACSQKIANISDQYRAEPLRPVQKKQDMEMKRIQHEPQQRASIAEIAQDSPPPLHPRQMRINQSMRGRISQDHSSRISPPKEMRDSRSQSMSQSKASYLASRRDRDRIVPDSETGSYKRTMSPNGHTISNDVISQSPQQNSTSTRSSKDLVKNINNNNNTNLLRRSSINEKGKKMNLSEKCDEKEDYNKKSNIVLPDVLPINAKLLSTRSQQQQIYRPTNLSLLETDTMKAKNRSPPTSPTKTPPRGSPLTPLRSTNLSNPPLLASCLDTTTTITKSLLKSPPSPKRISPQIKPSLSPIKLSSSSSSSPSPRHSSASSSSSSSATSSPLSSPKSSPPQSPKTEECPKVIEGLQLIQRTEVVLRVNTTTTDAASQTEKDELPPTPLPTRKKLQEEIECEKLSEDFVNHLPTSDRLKEILVPVDYKKPTDYVQGLFRVDITSRPRPANSPFRSRNNTPRSSPPPNVTTTINTTNSKISSPISPTLSEPTSPLSGSSTYFTISEPKAKFLNRYSQDMNQCHIVKDTKDLSQKKEELVSRLDRKLEVLRSEQLVVTEECKINDELGENVEAHIRRLARPHEADKFRLHIEEVGKITSLLLGLSGRLARAENALMNMSEDHPERRILENKRDKLLEQLDEAKKLKECIDRRSISVSNILNKYLNSEEYTDYDHFINMKAKLIMDSKEIADKIKLGEEQLLALKQTLIVTD